jgi:hypothetical protein
MGAQAPPIREIARFEPPHPPIFSGKTGSLSDPARHQWTPHAAQ